MSSMIDFTPTARLIFSRNEKRTEYTSGSLQSMQLQELKRLLMHGAKTRYGKTYGMHELSITDGNLYEVYKSSIPLIEYEDIRQYVMQMIDGEKDVLWTGGCKWYAQSSGTSGGKSKYIPVTEESLSWNHYRGGSDVVTNYLKLTPESKMFSGKGMILGGSFANSLNNIPKGVHIGDLSATLIKRINPLANIFRTPSKKIALLPDWEEKLPALVDAGLNTYVTNLSGVPSWFLTVLTRILEKAGCSDIHDVWPGLEVFFHGGISFGPYRAEYKKITSKGKMRFMETYNSSEGFFGIQNDFDDKSLLMLVNAGVFYEFARENRHTGAMEIFAPWEVKPGRIYELIITCANGLWRYRVGDTVKVIQADPLKVTVAGRTKAFINAFGEELMEHNTEMAIADVCHKMNCSVRNYTVAPVFSENGKKGRHQWFVEWGTPPNDVSLFISLLEECLFAENSDYEAKRHGNLFLDTPEVITVPAGIFEKWLQNVGNRKLGGQRKIPRLSNDRKIADAIIKLLSQQ